MKFKKIHIAAIIPGITFFAMGVLGAVFAYFTVSAISTGNVLETGSMQIHLSDDNETQSVEVQGSWGASNLMPGSQLPEKKIEIFNASTVDADHVDIQFSYEGDVNIAKNLLFSQSNNAFRYGGSGDGSSVNLNTALRGTTDTDYIVAQGSNGQPFATGTVDGIDGSVKDGKISLHELSLFGKIRIQRGDERGGIAAGTAADLWLNGEISPLLAAQNSQLTMKITVSLDQHASQF